MHSFFERIGAGISAVALSVMSLFSPAPAPVPVAVNPELQQIQTQINLIRTQYELLKRQAEEMQKFGAAIPVSVAVFETSLASGIGASDTSMTLVSGTDSAGNSLSGYIGFVIDEGGTTQEFVVGTASGTAVTGMLRGISPTDGDLEVTALKKTHRRGATVKITTHPIVTVMARILNGDETIPNILQYATSSATSTIQNNIYNLAHVGYVNAVASSGVADATTVTAGKVEEATIAEINAKSQTGGTGARLIMTPETFASSSYGLGSAFHGTDSATSTDAYVMSANIALSGYATGTHVSVLVNQPNTGAATLNVNSLGAKSILREDGTALQSGDIRASSTISLIYDGTSFRLVSRDYVPVGTIEMYATSTAPNGWLSLDGTEYATTTYPNLFALIGYQYGGSTSTFKVPNMKGRKPVGYGSATTTYDVLGETGGEDNHTLTEAEMPAHTHSYPYDSGAGAPGSGNAASWTGSQGTSHNTSQTGGGTAHNVLDPFLVVNFIIKF